LLVIPLGDALEKALGYDALTPQTKEVARLRRCRWGDGLTELIRVREV
jgi:hypothetical protein